MGLLVGAAAPVAGQEPRQAVADLRLEIEEARRSNLPYITPRHFSTAREALREAETLLDRGAGVQPVLAAVSRGRRALASARDSLARGRKLLSEALEAREDAIAAGARERAPDLWARAESRLREGGRAWEGGNPEEARRKASEAADRYRAAARTAVEERILGLARAARKGAVEFDAPELAPRTFARANSLLARADSAIARATGPDGSDEALVRARTLADSADLLFRRAARRAAVADTARRREAGIERTLIRYESALQRLVDSLHITGAVPGEPGGVADSALAALARRAATRAELRRMLDSARRSGRRAGERADSLARLLEARTRELDSLRAELGRRRRRARKLREVRALFGESEARILAAGDSLVLQLVGLTFPPGETEVRESARSLLVKVQSVIEKFPEAEIVVAGHTDSRGDEERNRTLSRQRAISVREWLLTHLPISADRVSSVGYGESRPVASNDTEEGRALNRRIDVILRLPPP